MRLSMDMGQEECRDRKRTTGLGTQENTIYLEKKKSMVYLGKYWQSRCCLFRELSLLISQCHVIDLDEQSKIRQDGSIQEV